MPPSRTTIAARITQNAVESCSPGTPTFMPQMLATSVSGRTITENAVRTRKVSLVRCAIADSFVDSSASTTSL